MVDGQTSVVRAALAAVCLVLLAGCRDSLPTAPSDLADGIVVYEHADYLGASAHLTDDLGNLKDVKGPCLEYTTDAAGSSITDSWNDCISSVRVAPGWRATLYSNFGFRGDQLQVTEDIPNLRGALGNCPQEGFNDCVSSIRIFRP